MRLLALLIASTALSASATAALAADFTAGLSIGGSQLSYQFLDTEDEVAGFYVQGLLSGAYNFTPVLGVQGDLLVHFENLDEDNSGTEVSSIDGALHAFYRDSQRFLAGGFIQLGKDEFSDGGTGNIGSTRYAGGVEGQAFFDQLTLYGQVGLQGSDPDNVDINFEGWFITGEVRYFLTPDFKLEAHVGRSELTIEEDVVSLDFATLNFGFGAEYKLADLPLSLTARYDYTTTELPLVADASYDSHRVLVGLKFNLGEETLLDRDRNGASLKPLDFGTVNNMIAAFPVLASGGP